MEANTKNEIDLNKQRKAEEDLEASLQELYLVTQKIMELELPNGYTTVSISKYGEVKIGDNLKTVDGKRIDGIIESDVYSFEIENKQGEKITQLYKLKDDELSLVAQINANRELLLSMEERKKFQGIIQEDELIRTHGPEEQTIEGQHDLKVDLRERTDSKEDSDREMEITKALGVSPDNILMIVEVKDEYTMSNVLNRNLETKNLYAVKLKQDSGGVGSNDWIIVNQKANGKFEQAMKQDPSDTMQDIGQTVGVKNNNLQAPDFAPGDLNAVSRNGTRHIGANINGTRFNDEYGVLETQKDYKTTVHIVREQDGKGELLCEDEHSEHDEEKIEFLDRDIEINEDDQDEQRTPGGDAYERRFNHSH